MLPIETRMEPTDAHPGVQDRFRHWSPPAAPDPRQSGLRTARPFWTCGYCASMHPAEVAEALEAGAVLDMADRKYGWPHKAYVRGAPNRFAGHMEVRVTHHQDGVATPGPELPAAETDGGKFYFVHLDDALPEHREIIERAAGLRFTFDKVTGKVRWSKYEAVDHAVE